jgi:hypothetical protein
MPWIGINKTIRKTVAYIILFNNRTRDILFTQNENKILFRICLFSICSFQILNSLKQHFDSYIIYSPIFMIKLYFCLACEVWVLIGWMGHNVTVLELACQIGKWRHNDIIGYVIKYCHSVDFVAKKKEIGQEFKTLKRL